MSKISRQSSTPIPSFSIFSDVRVLFSQALQKVQRQLTAWRQRKHRTWTSTEDNCARITKRMRIVAVTIYTIPASADALQIALSDYNQISATLSGSLGRSGGNVVFADGSDPATANVLSHLSHRGSKEPMTLQTVFLQTETQRNGFIGESRKKDVSLQRMNLCNSISQCTLETGSVLA